MILPFSSTRKVSAAAVPRPSVRGPSGRHKPLALVGLRSERDNQIVRLMRRIGVRKGPPAEDSELMTPTVQPAQHVTTERLKRQFEERLTERMQRRRPPK